MINDALLQITMSALADIAFSEDMTLQLARTKAARIYKQIQATMKKEECDR